MKNAGEVREAGFIPADANDKSDQRAVAHSPPPLERYLGLVFRLVPGLVWATDRLMRITYVHGRVPGVPKIDAARATMMTVPDVIGARGSGDKSVAAHLAALAGESQALTYEYGGRTFNVSIEPVRADDGAVVGCLGAAIDYTERRLAEEALAASRRRLEEAQRVAHVGSFEWDVRSNRVTWSDELHRIYGLATGTFPGTFEAFARLVYPGDEHKMNSVIFNALRNPGPFSYDHRVVRSDGATRVLHTRGDVIGGDDRAPTRVVGSCWDVTDVTEAHEQVKRTASLLEGTLNATADGILVIGRTGAITAYNRRFLDMWRIPDEIVKVGSDDRLLTFVQEQLVDPEAFVQHVRDLYQHADRESFDVLRFVDGRVFERYSRPQRSGDQITGRVWSFRDVTDREALLQRALFLADAGRLLASLDAEAALESVAHLSVPFLGEICAVDLIQDGGPRRLVVVAREGAGPDPELHISALSGHPTTAHVDGRSSLAVPLVIGGEVAAVLTFVAREGRQYRQEDIDLADELAQRASLTLSNARLYRGAGEALRSREEFLAIAAHEIRGPIASMHLAVQALQRDGADPATTARLLSVIGHDEQRLTRFVEELLDVGRIRSGQLIFRIEDVDIAAVVRDVAARMGPELAASGSTVSINAGAALVGRWDRLRIEQVVQNLLSNAIKFGLGRPIEIVVDKVDGMAHFAVKDRGVGIAPELRETIFQPFARLVSVRHYGGLGLGLHIVRVIVEGLGGSVSVDSELGVGSTFTVELPLQAGAS